MRSGVAAGLCLLVVASVLSVGVAASGLSGEQTTNGLTIDAAASDLSVGQTAAGHPDQPDKCNVGERASSDATEPNLTIVPHENTVAADEWGAAVICVVNPAGRDEPLDLWLEVWHNGSAEDASLLLVGPDEQLTGPPTQHVMPIDRQSKEGYAHFVDPGSLPPGTGTQYAVVVAEEAATGDYRLTARLYPDRPPNPDDWATIHVVDTRCGWFCGAGRWLDGVMAIFGDGVRYLRTHPPTLVAFLGLLVAVAGLSARLYSSEWFQSRVFRFGDGSGDPDDPRKE